MRRWFVLVLLICPLAAMAAWQPLGPVTAVQSMARGVEIHAGHAAFRITAIAPAVLRLRYAPNGVFPADRSWAVVEATGFTAPEMQLRQTANTVELSAGELRVRVEKSSALVSFLNASGDVLMQEQAGQGPAWDGAAFRVAMPPIERDRVIRRSPIIASPRGPTS